MEKTLSFHNSKGEKLVGILNETSRKDWAIIMAHGFSSNKNTKNFVKIAETLGQKNIATFRFDFWGHGESDGAFENITITEAVDDVLHAIAFIKNLGYRKLALLGSSFGGISSILAAAKTNDLSFLMLKSPVSDYWEVEKNICTQPQLDEWKRSGFREYEDEGRLLKLNWSFVEDFKNNNTYEAAQKITIPTLIVHGDADEIVPYTQSKKLVDMLPHAHLIAIKGSDHSYTNRSHAQIMRDALCNFAIEQITKSSM